METRSGGRSDLRTVTILLVLVVLIVVVGFGYLAFTAGNFVSDKLTAATDMVAGRSGLSPYLVKGLGLIVTIPLFVAFARLTKNWVGLLGMVAPATDPLQMYRKKEGLVVVGYMGAFWILMWWASRDAYAYRFCADMPDGTVVSSDHPGKEPRFGTPFHPCTVDDTKVALNADGKLTAAHEIPVRPGRRITWFNAATGKAQVWYSQRDDGYHFFDRAGNDPESGDALQPVSPKVVSAYEASRRAFAQQAVSVREQKEADTRKQQQASDDAAAASQAQILYDGRNYKGALQTCNRVLSHGPNDACTEVKHEASVQLAHTLVDQGQAQLQRAQFDEAIRSATEAVQLNPENEPAKRLRDLAHALQQKASLD